ncbi:MAG: SURF1 family protein [Pseudomonadota bacterium]|nr:MAG: SURF1 family protein [Pseudomonadota bacterium]
MALRFRPPLAATLAVVLLVPSMIALGLWQLQRAEEKRVLQTAYDQRANEEPIGLATYVQEASDLRFRKIRARGSYEDRYQLLLDNRVHHGRPGYHVISPFRVEGSEVRVLVNRGWIAMGPSRQQLPAVDTPTGTVEIVGTAMVPTERPFVLGKLETLRERNLTVWQQLDMQRYAQSAPFAVQPAVLLLDPVSPAGGFTREWTRLDSGIAVHQGYAFQWFALAAVLVVLYVYFGRRAGRGPKSAPDTLQS